MSVLDAFKLEQAILTMHKKIRDEYNSISLTLKTNINVLKIFGYSKYVESLSKPFN